MRKLVLTLLFIAMSISPVYAGEAILTWTASTTNEDGSPLTDLAGYKIHHAFQSYTTQGIPDEPPTIIYPTGVSIIPGSKVTFIHTGLKEATHYYRVTILDEAGNESDFSNEGKKNVVTTPEATTDLIVQ